MPETDCHIAVIIWCEPGVDLAILINALRDKSLHQRSKATIWAIEVYPSGRLLARRFAALGPLAVQGIRYMRKIVFVAAAAAGALALSACSQAEDAAAEAEAMAEEAADAAGEAADAAGEAAGDAAEEAGEAAADAAADAAEAASEAAADAADAMAGE